MTLPKSPKEGDKTTCPDCGAEIVARLKTYKDNKFPSYVQWQQVNDTIAHKTKDGECNLSPHPKPSSDDYLIEKQKEIQSKIKELKIFTPYQEEQIKKRTLELFKINSLIRDTLEAFDPAPNPAMIGQFTNIIQEESKNYPKEQMDTDGFLEPSDS